MIDYGIDLGKPFLVLEEDETHVIVNGSSKVLQTTDGEFGGTEGTWRVPKTKLLNKRQKRAIRWKRRLLGDRMAEIEYKRACDIVIASHTNGSSAGW